MMGRTVHELECSISYKELLDWAHYWGAVEPYPEIREDTRSAMLCKIVADLPSIIFGKKPTTKLEDFLLKFDADKPAREPEKQRSPRKGRGANVSADVITGMFVLAGMTESTLKAKERQRK